MRSPFRNRRPGFTLVELLVAIAVAIALGAATVAVINSGAANSQDVVRGADKVSSWLITAKMRAIRSGRPHGVRFLVSPSNSNLRAEAEYVEIPDLFVPNPSGNPDGGRIFMTYNLDANNNILANGRKVFYVDNTAGMAAFVARNPPIGLGDVLNLPEFLPASQYPIRSVDTVTDSTQFGTAPSSGLVARELKLGGTPTDPVDIYPDVRAALPPTPNKSHYVTYRASFSSPPSPVFGDPILQLGNIAVDATAGAGSPGENYPPDNTVMFNPFGQVMNTQLNPIAIWVRDPSKATLWSDFANAGEQTLVVVMPRTGAIATRPVFQGATPFQSMRDATNTGF